MDGALSSSRHDSGGGRGHDYNRGRRHYRGGRGGGGYHGRRHHPYGGGGGRRNRPPRSPGNRFNSAQHSTKSVDPKVAMMQQLSAMVSRVGQVSSTTDTTTATTSMDSTTTSENKMMRPVVQAISKNISDLAQVLCKKENAALFLGFTQNDNQDSIIKAEEEAGHLAHLVVSCVLALPMQTSTYVGLTLAVNELAPQGYGGFASRCVVYAMRLLSSELDALLLTNTTTKTTVLRIQHLLRYLALLGNVNIVAGFESNVNEESMTNGTWNSVTSMLQSFVKLATSKLLMEKKKHSVELASVLAHLVLSTLPYLMDHVPHDVLQETLLEPLENNLFVSYKSNYWPGLGKYALLLKQEQKEGSDDEEDDEEEEDDDEAGQRCDTLQDLLRTVKTLLQSPTTRFALLSDAPWLGLKMPPADETTMPQEEETQQQEETNQEEPLLYSGEPLLLSLSPDCKSTPHLMMDATGDDSDLCLGIDGSDGIVVGRLPIFGPPPSDNDDEEEEEDGMDDEQAPKNTSLQAYQTNFNLVDRFFLSDTIRDCLQSHKSSVSDSGLERGSAKDTAQQVWEISHAFVPGKKEETNETTEGDQNANTAPGEGDLSGIQYGIIETILSLIVQSTSPQEHFYLSRVLLELTRLQPTVMSQALVVGVANLVQDYLPSLVPCSRVKLSQWFAFHLTNTDYQWPAGYWQHWGVYVSRLEKKKRNSRGDFVLGALQSMASLVSSVSVICTDCLPPTSTALANSLLTLDNGSADQEEQRGSALKSIQKELELRLWDANEDPDATRAYMVGDEVNESVSGQEEKPEPWWRTRVVMRAILRPAKLQYHRMNQTVEKAQSDAQQADQNDMTVDDNVRDEETKHDVLTEITDMLVRYKPVLLATRGQDCESLGQEHGNDESLLVNGESHLLLELEDMVGYSLTMSIQCVTCMLHNQIVSGMAVLKWALRDYGETQAGFEDSIAVSQWWDLAALALRVGLDVELSKNSETGPDSIGMVIDTVGEDTDSQVTSQKDSVSKLAKQMLEFATPLMQYVTQRVCSMLSKVDYPDGKLKHTPEEVNLIEGLKQFVVSTYSLLLSECISRSTADDVLSKGIITGLFASAASRSDLAGEKLASLCRDKTCPATEVLAQILEGI